MAPSLLKLLVSNNSYRQPNNFHENILWFHLLLSPLSVKSEIQKQWHEVAFNWHIQRRIYLPS